MKTQRRDGMLGFHSHFDVRPQQVYKPPTQLHPTKSLGTCYGPTVPQGYWMRTEGTGHMNIFQGPYRESKPEPGVFCRSVGYVGKRRTPVLSGNGLPARNHVTSFRKAVKTSPFTPLILILSSKRCAGLRDALQMNNLLSRASCLLRYGT